jgi:flavin reductase (DIM6/NTAB) family NADH-FMN oxidoreductase RutF
MNHPDPAEFRKAVSRFTTGVTVITSREQDSQVVAMTVNSFTSVSLSPPTVLVSLTHGRTLTAIRRHGRFGINVLPASSRALSGHFAGRRVPGLEPEFEETGGMPKLARAIAYFDCSVDRSLVVADHTLLVGIVRTCNHAEDDPLVFFSSRYHDLGAQHGSGGIWRQANDKD